LDDMRCSAIIVRNKGFFVWAKTYTECINRLDRVSKNREPFLKGKVQSTVDLLALTSSGKLLIILKVF